MSVQITIGRASKRTFIAEIVTLPAIVTVNSRRDQIFPPLIIGIIATGFAYFTFTTSEAQTGLISLPSFIALVFAAAGALNLARAFNRIRSGDQMTFNEKFVEVTEQGPFRSINWRADYREFLGLRHREKRSSEAADTIPFQIIELIHKDETKTLPLYAVRERTKPIDHLNHYADVLETKIIS